MSTFGSLFAGIGGIDLGLEQAGWLVAWQVELDVKCQGVLARHWPEIPRFGDIHDVGKQNLARVDLIAFGSPCQDLSIAGKRGGLAGERSGLFYEAVRVIRELRPAFALWENVPGAFSSHGGRDFGAALDALADAGAMDISWTVLDAQWFGVAQRRRRLFLVADFGGERAHAVQPESESGDWHPPPSREAGQRPAYARAASVRGTGDGHGNAWNSNYVAAIPILDPNGRTGASTDDPQYAIGIGKPGDPMYALTSHENAVAYQCQGTNVGEMGTLRRGNGNITGGVPFVAHTLGSHGRGSVTEDGTGRGVPLVIHNGQGSPTTDVDRTMTLDTETPPAITQGMAVRRLMPVECERLQGLPDGWTTGHSDSARYRMIGNSVAVPVLKWVGQRLLEALGGV